MRGELPILKRCCFCFPLRHGLLLWGYFKLIVAAALLYPMAFYMMFFLHMTFFGPLGFIINLLIFISILLDFAFNIALVVAGHTKNHKIFRAYFYYTITLTGISVALSITVAVLAVFTARPHHNTYLEIMLSCVSIFVYIVLQTYIILLLRSEAIKLENDGQFYFVNNEADAECILNMHVEAELSSNTVKRDLKTEKEDKYINDSTQIS